MSKVDGVVSGQVQLQFRHRTVWSAGLQLSDVAFVCEQLSVVGLLFSEQGKQFFQLADGRIFVLQKIALEDIDSRCRVFVFADELCTSSCSLFRILTKYVFSQFVQQFVILVAVCGIVL